MIDLTNQTLDDISFSPYDENHLRVGTRGRRDPARLDGSLRTGARVHSGESGNGRRAGSRVALVMVLERGSLRLQGLDELVWS